MLQLMYLGLVNLRRYLNVIKVMYSLVIAIFSLIIYSKCFAQMMYESDLNFRVDPGSKTCFYESGKTGQLMEVYYQVVDGQHGDLDISLDVIDPKAKKIVSDYKKSQNSIIMDLEEDGDYAFCLDNTYSLMNSKLVFLYVLIEDKEGTQVTEQKNEAEVAVVDTDGSEKTEEEVLEWTGTYDNGEKYYLEVASITETLSRTLKHVIKARHLLDIYGANKARDSYIAIEDTFIVDMWSGLQISLMFIVGLLQVYTIKKLFSPCSGYKSMY